MHGLQAAGGTRSLKPYRLLVLVAAIVTGLDQLTKQLALDGLSDGPVDVIPGVLRLRLTFNSGGAFGLLQGVPGFFLVATVVVLALILVWARRVEDSRLIVALGLVLGGGLGNLLDRVARPYQGRVIDFIDLHVWPIFNVADMSIVVGTGAVLLLWAGEGRRQAARERESRPEVR